MSDPRRTTRGWYDQVRGLLTGNRRRWTTGRAERHKQRDHDRRAAEARRRQQSDEASEEQ